MRSAAPVDTDRQAETALAGSGRSLGSAVTGEAGQAPYCPSEHHRSFIYINLISPGSGACLTSGPDTLNTEQSE
jgi:hypothetical protein